MLWLLHIVLLPQELEQQVQVFHALSRSSQEICFDQVLLCNIEEDIILWTLANFMLSSILIAKLEQAAVLKAMPFNINNKLSLQRHPILWDCLGSEF